MASVWIREYTLKKGGKSYHIYYIDPVTGETKLFATLRKKTIADRKATELRHNIDKGNLPDIELAKKKFRPLSLEKCSGDYIKACKENVEHEDMSPATLDFYRYQHDKVLAELGKKTLVSSLTTSSIKTYHSGVKKSSSPRTANARLLALKMIIKTGLKEGALSQDVSEGINFFKEPVRKRTLRPQELDKLLQACGESKSGKAMAAAILLGVEHGCARQEILDLRESDIDWEQKKVGTIKFHRRKNDEERLQFLMPGTRKALRELIDYRMWLRHRKGITEFKSDLVFGRLDGRPIARFDTAWENVLARAGIEDFHFHDLRTVYGTNLAYAGAGLPIIQKLIGHKDPRSTQRYVHIAELMQLRPWQARLAAMLEDPETFEAVLAGGEGIDASTNSR